MAFPAMHATARVSAFMSACLALLFLAGCGGSSGRQVISGSVTFDGQLVVYGTITFSPDTAKGGTGPQGSAEIRNGRYQTEGEKGPVLGPQVVRITGWKSSPEEGVLGAPLFNDYTTSVEVAAASHQLDFDIPDPKKPKQK
jgi:hypothetical protein